MTQSPRIVLLGCARSAGVAIEELARLGRALPEGVEWASLPCGSTLDVLHILRAFEAGADRVMVLACFEGACRSLNGSQWAAKRVEAARAILEEAGVAGWRLAYHPVAPNMPADVLHWLETFEEPAPIVDEKPS